MVTDVTRTPSRDVVDDVANAWWRRGVEVGAFGLTLLALLAMSRVRGPDWVALPLGLSLAGCFAYRRIRWLRFARAEFVFVVAYFAIMWWRYKTSDVTTPADVIMPGLDALGLVILFPAQAVLWTGRRTLQELILLGLVAVSQFLYGMALAPWTWSSWALAVGFFPLLVFAMIQVANARALEGAQAETVRPRRMLRRDAIAALALMPIVLALAVSVFYALPRRATVHRAFFPVDGNRRGVEVETPDVRPGTRPKKTVTAGIGSDRIQLNDTSGRLQLDDTPVLRCSLQLENADRPLGAAYEERLHLRVRILDDYDGKTWTTNRVGSPRRHDPDPDDRIALPGPPPRPGWGTTLEVTPLPGRDRAADRLLVAAGRPCSVDSPNSLLGYPEEVLSFSKRPREGDRYTVHGERVLQWSDARAIVRRHGLSADHEEHDFYTALPEREQADRVAALAKRIVAGAVDDVDRIDRIVGFVRRKCTYSLELVGERAGENPTAHFLFESCRGHCELFSDAVAVLCRHVGIPTRIVTGLQGGTYVSFPPGFEFQMRDAHAWCEVHFAGLGWVGVDATPAADPGSLGLLPPSDGVGAEEFGLLPRGFDGDAQMSLYRRVGRALGGAVASPFLWAAVVACVALVWLRRRRRPGRARGDGDGPQRPSDPVQRLFRLLARHGIHPARGETALEVARRAEARLDVEVAGPIERVYAERFGGASLSDDDRQMIDRWLRSVARAAPRPVSPATPGANAAD